MKRRVLVTGCNGQLGTDLMQALQSDHDVRGVDIDDFDITHAGASQSAIEAIHPSVVFHTAAYTDVDGSEANREKAMKVNAVGTENIARACRNVGARLIFYSTDYVFDGNKKTPYLESDPTNPQTIYGRSKLEAEKSITEILDDYAILRIAWLYGQHGKNFVRTIIELGCRQNQSTLKGIKSEPLKVVDDQIGNLTWTVDVALQSRIVLESDLKGLLHCTSEGEASWYDIACRIFELLKLDVAVQPCSTDEYPRPAPRPKRSSLENHRLKELGLNCMRPYQGPLETFLSAYREELLTCNVR